MHRTHISLEENQYRNLRHYAQNQKLSISAIIRDLLDKHVPDIQSDDLIVNSLQQLKGVVSGKGEFKGSDHNTQLYKHKNDWRDEQL